MAKFCGKCGSKLDDVTGLCPRCDRDQLNAQLSQAQADKLPGNESENQGENPKKQTKRRAKKQAKKQKKAERKAAKKEKKKAKKAAMTTKQKVRRFVLKLAALLVVVAILITGGAGLLAYFGVAEIPVLSGLMERAGIGYQSEEGDGEFHTLPANFTDVQVVDEASAILAAKEASDLLGLGNAADELTIQDVNTVDEITYYKMQQNYKGIPVYGRTMVVMADTSGATKGFSTNAVEIQDTSLDLNININVEAIKNAISTYLSTEKSYKNVNNIILPENLEKNIFIYNLDETLEHKQVCIIPIIFDYSDGTAALTVIIDIHENKVIGIEQSIYADTAVCYGKDKSAGSFNGLKIADGTYVMKDTDRNIYIYNGQRQNVTDPNSGKIFQDVAQEVASKDEYFGNDDDNGKEYDRAFALLQSVSKVYDYYESLYQDVGVGSLVAVYNDNVSAYNGGNAVGGTVSIRSIRSQGLPDNNNPYEMTGFVSFGTNYCSDFSNYIDLLGHEYTHFISRNIVNWISVDTSSGATNEPGAINEGYSDIFGEIIESSLNGTAPDWTHGNRVISDPTTNDYPDKVTYKYDGHFFILLDRDMPEGDFSHTYSTVVSHAAYLMSNDSENGILNMKELSDLWYNTLHTLPSNCTFVMLRENMEMTAEALGFSEEQKQCVSAAFDEVGIERQEDGEETYSTDATLTVTDQNGDPYDDYTVSITGKKYRGFLKTGLWKEDYHDEMTVTDRKPVALNLPKGDYTITVTDNFDKSQTAQKTVKIRSGNKPTEIVMATNFGFDYAVRSDAQMSVFDMNNQLYGNYSAQITGTYKNSDGDRVSYSDTITADSNNPVELNLPEGGYNFLLTDALDTTKTKSVTVQIRSMGASALQIPTNFGVKAGQFDAKNVPADAVEFNGHYYYIYKDEKSWSDANDYCKSLSGYLATITTQEEQNFIQQYLAQVTAGATAANDAGEPTTWEKEVWIGATDSRFEGDWEWANGEKFEYTNWGTNQPDDSWGQDYGVMLNHLREGSDYSITAGQWDDSNSYNCPFICEWGEYTPESAYTETNAPSQHTTSDGRDIVLVLDTSGSMSGTPIEETRKASVNFIDTILQEDASIGIVTYEDSANMLSDFSMDRNALESVVSGIDSGGSTNIEAGLQMARDMLEYSNAEKKIIVLMSDGVPNMGKQGEELISYADEIKAEGTYIYTLGFFESLGDKASAQALMEGIASEGCHYEVDSADNLVFFFGDIADQINGTKYIYIRIACPVDVTVSYNGETLDSDEENLSTRTSFGSLTFEEYEDETSGDDAEDRIKVLRLKEGTDYDIEINGTGRGKMDYTIGFMDETGEYSDLRKFRNIAITSRTKIDTVATVSNSTVLNVDEDGDGKYDLKYKAGENEFGELVDYTYVIYIAAGAVALLIVLIVGVKMRKRFRKKGSKNN